MLKGIDRAEIESARPEATDIWSAGNATLYSLCAEFPLHTDAQKVIGKLWLIGRAYTAAIERRPTSREKQKVPIDEYYRRAARALANSGLDGQLALLRGRQPKGGPRLGPGAPRSRSGRRSPSQPLEYSSAILCVQVPTLSRARLVLHPRQRRVAGPSTAAGPRSERPTTPPHGRRGLPYLRGAGVGPTRPAGAHGGPCTLHLGSSTGSFRSKASSAAGGPETLYLSSLWR